MHRLQISMEFILNKKLFCKDALLKSGKVAVIWDL